MIKKGDCFRFVARHSSGAQFGQALADGTTDTIKVRLGHLSTDGEFLPKTFTKGGTPSREAVIPADTIGEVLFNQKVMEITTTMQQENVTAETEVRELTVELDTDAPANGAKPKETVAEKKARIQKEADDKKKALDKAEKDKEQAAKDKEAEKAKKAAQKRTDTLKPLLAGTGLKEREAALRFSGGEGAPGAVEKFADLNDEQVKAAKEGLKALAKNIKKLSDAATKAGVKVKSDADVIAGLVDTDAATDVTRIADLSPSGFEQALAIFRDKAKEQSQALAARLSEDDRKDFAKLEKEVERYLPTYQTATMQIGGPLAIISARRLYRETHKTFEAYCMERYGLSRPHAYSIMAAAQTHLALTEGQIVDLKHLPSITAAEAIHRGTLKLAKAAGIENDAEFDAVVRQMSRNIYQLAVQNAPVDQNGNAILAPGYLQSIFNVMGDIAAAGGAVEVDGKQVPISLAAATIDEMITAETVERTATAKAFLAEEFARRAEAAKADRAARLDGITNTATGNGKAIPEGVTPRLTVVCSVHSKAEIEETTDVSLRLGCGCVFLSTTEGYMFEKNTKEGVTA